MISIGSLHIPVVFLDKEASTGLEVRFLNLKELIIVVVWCDPTCEHSGLNSDELSTQYVRRWCYGRQICGSDSLFPSVGMLQRSEVGG